MRILLAALALLTIVSSCKKETLAPVGPIEEMVDSSAMLQLSGEFMSGPYGTVSGDAQLYKNFDGSFEVKLENFSTTNGPDLYVYLSKEIMPVNFIELGKLKSIAGNQVYEVSGTPDFTAYKYICIHCKAFNHLFGYALIKK